MVKYCNKCDQHKDLSCFYKSSRTADGLQHYCKDCQNASRIEWARNNPEKVKENRTRWYLKNSSKIKEWKAEYRRNNTEKIAEYEKKRWRENKAELSLKNKIYHKENASKIKERKRKWFKDNREQVNRTWLAWFKGNPEYRKKKYLARRSNPINCLHDSMKNSIGKAIRRNKNGYPWEYLVPYTINDLKLHLEALFDTGMTWENYGDWHIDHKKPICSFNFDGPNDPEFQECWSLENLQPLWALDNIRKGGRV